MFLDLEDRKGWIGFLRPFLNCCVIFEFFDVLVNLLVINNYFWEGFFLVLSINNLYSSSHIWLIGFLQQLQPNLCKC